MEELKDKVSYCAMVLWCDVVVVVVVVVVVCSDISFFCSALFSLLEKMKVQEEVSQSLLLSMHNVASRVQPYSFIRLRI